MRDTDRDPLVTSPRVKGRSIFTIIGGIVVALVAVVVLYYAWVGWRSKGQPVPDVTVTTRPAAMLWHERSDLAVNPLSASPTVRLGLPAWRPAWRVA
jgi:flagellar basal body-associated protein FliL